MLIELHRAGKVASLRPRVTWRDAIVISGAILAFLVGWGIKTWHDDRLTSAEVDGISISYPRGWVQLPGMDPVKIRAVSTSDPLTSFIYGSAEAQQPDVVLAGTMTIINPARHGTAYTPLSSRPTTVDGQPAVVTDYAYVDSASGGTIPVVIQGREYTWLVDGQLHAVALEAPEREWEHVEGRMDDIVGSIET